MLIFRRKHGKANVTSPVERKSRFTVLLSSEDKRSAAVLAGIGETLRPLPEAARRTITFDRGTEFAGHAIFDRRGTRPSRRQRPATERWPRHLLRSVARLPPIPR